MSVTQVGEGARLTLVAPGGGVVKDEPEIIGGLIVVPLETAAAAASFVGVVGGEWDLAKQAALAITQGAAVYWDTAANEVDTTTTNVRVGVCTLAAAANDTTVRVLLNGFVRTDGLDVDTIVAAAATIVQTAYPTADLTVDNLTSAVLTDNTGGAAADGTLAVVTPAAAITDNSGGVDPGNNTIAAVTNINAITDSTGGTPGAGTFANLADGTTYANDHAAIENNFATTAAELATQRTANTAILAAIAQLAAKQNTTSTAITSATNGLTECVDQITKGRTDLVNVKENLNAIVDALQALT